MISSTYNTQITNSDNDLLLDFSINQVEDEIIINLKSEKTDIGLKLLLFEPTLYSYCFEYVRACKVYIDEQLEVVLKKLVDKKLINYNVAMFISHVICEHCGLIATGYFLNGKYNIDVQKKLNFS